MAGPKTNGRPGNRQPDRPGCRGCTWSEHEDSEPADGPRRWGRLEAIVFQTRLAFRNDPVLSLLNAKPVPRGVAHGGVADAPGLAGGLLQYLRTGRGGDLVEGRVEVAAGEGGRGALP